MCKNTNYWNLNRMKSFPLGMNSYPYGTNVLMTAGDDQVDLVDEKCGARFVRRHQWRREDLNFITVKFQIYIKCVGQGTG